MEIKMLTTDLKSTIRGFHDFLTALHGEERLVSDILHEYGLTGDSINKLKTENLAEFYENIRFAMICRFLHHSDKRMMLAVIERKYGLFGSPKETIAEIADSMNIAQNGVRQLERRATKNLKGGMLADTIGIVITLAACKTLGIDSMVLLQGKKLERAIEIDNDNNIDTDIDNLQDTELPESEFYIQGSFNYGTKLGSYQLLMVFGEHIKYFEEENLEGTSDVSMILTAVINGLELLKKPCAVMVYSNTLFGLTSIYKKGKIRLSIPQSAANYELKERIRRLMLEKGHMLDNFVESNMRKIISDYRK